MYNCIGDIMKRMNLKKKHKLTFVWFILVVLCSYVGIKYTICQQSPDSNPLFIKYILGDINSYVGDTKSFFTDFFNTFSPIKMIKNNLYESANFVFSANDYPVVYIYNTHNQEEYIKDTETGADVTDAASLLGTKLNNLDVKTLVESRKVSDYRDAHNMDFYQSYKVSRIYLLDTLKIYPDLKLIIDLHRDSLDRKYTFTTIDNKNYAKVLFVVGEKYSTYKTNLTLVNKINEAIKNKYSTLSRGIMFKDKALQNGIYNQDVNGNAILMELGSNNNNMSEVYNTIDVLAPIIKEVIDEI